MIWKSVILHATVSKFIWKPVWAKNTQRFKKLTMNPFVIDLNVSSCSFSSILQLHAKKKKNMRRFYFTVFHEKGVTLAETNPNTITGLTRTLMANKHK